MYSLGTHTVNPLNFAVPLISRFFADGPVREIKWPRTRTCKI